MEDDPLISSQFKSKKTNVNSSKGAYTNLNLNTRGQTTSQGRNKETASSCKYLAFARSTILLL